MKQLPISMGSRKAIWLTDLHLNFLDYRSNQEFINQIRNEKPEIILIGGDTGESQNVFFHLKRLDKSLDSEIYFVLGNHDFYNGSLSEVRKEASKATKHSEKLFYLDKIPFVELTNDTALIGHSSWADGRLGNYEKSKVMLEDYLLVKDFCGLTKTNRLRQLNKLGDEAASKLQSNLEKVVGKYKNILCLTHVPPFRESCWHEESISGDYYLPHFACKAVGDVLRSTMQRNPDSNLTVLCGHTHSFGKVKILDNLEVITGGAKYGQPKIQKVIHL